MLSSLLFIFLKCPDGFLCFSWAAIFGFLALLGIPAIVVLVLIFSRKQVTGNVSAPSGFLTFSAILAGIFATLNILGILFFTITDNFRQFAEEFQVVTGAVYTALIANIVFSISFVIIVIYLEYVHKRLQSIEDRIDRN